MDGHADGHGGRGTAREKVGFGDPTARAEHELRNLLQTILLNAELLEARAGSPQEGATSARSAEIQAIVQAGSQVERWLDRFQHLSAREARARPSSSFEPRAPAGASRPPLVTRKRGCAGSGEAALPPIRLPDEF